MTPNPIIHNKTHVTLDLDCQFLSKSFGSTIDNHQSDEKFKRRVRKVEPSGGEDWSHHHFLYAKLEGCMLALWQMAMVL